MSIELFDCLEFVSLCAEHFSVLEGVIMNSESNQIICKIDSQTLRETLQYFANFSSTTIPFDEAEIV